MYRIRYGFEERETEDGIISVKKDELYDSRKGYGFVTGQNQREQELLQIPALNSGFDMASCEDAPAEGLPLVFKADVPEMGNYMVTVWLKANEDSEDILLLLGKRRLVWKGKLSAGEHLRYARPVNLCRMIPRGRKEAYDDKSVDVTIIGGHVSLVEVGIEELDCPTVYLAGDSTVTDQSADCPYEPGKCYCGWGQMLPAWLNGKAAVSNHAHSGLTTETFRTDGHQAVLLSQIKEGDFFLIQFGTNDKNREHLKAGGGYRANLHRYIGEIREKGAYPVIVTPIAQNKWENENGEYIDTLEDYAEVCHKIGMEEGVPVLDLHVSSREAIRQMGNKKAEAYFYPKDDTHLNDYGGYLMAGMVADEISRVCSGFPGYGLLAACVTDGFGKWEAET